MPVLKTRRNNEEKELDFEIEYQLSLTTAQRFKMMLKKSREMIELMKKNGQRRPLGVFKRTK